MTRRLTVSQVQPNTGVYQQQGETRCYREILLVDNVTGIDVVVKVESYREVIDEAFAEVVAAITGDRP